MRRPVAAGARRRRFILERPQETADGFGGAVVSWVAGPQLWGSLDLIAATERVRAGRAEQAATYEVALRWRDDVGAAMRLALGPRRFAIRSVADPDGRRRVLLCRVEEVAP